MKCLFVGGPLDDTVVEVNDEAVNYTYEDSEGNASYYGVFVLYSGESIFVWRGMSYSQAVDKLAQKEVQRRMTSVSEEAPPKEPAGNKPKK